MYSSPQYGLFLDFNSFAWGVEESDLCLTLFDSACGVEAISEPLWVWAQNHRTGQAGRENRVQHACSIRVILDHIAQDCIQIVLKHLRGGKLHNLFGSSVWSLAQWRSPSSCSSFPVQGRAPSTAPYTWDRTGCWAGCGTPGSAPAHGLPQQQPLQAEDQVSLTLKDFSSIYACFL